MAVISDVHGNVTALRAVLADIERRGTDRIVSLGDVAGKGPRGSEAVAITRQTCLVTVRGNWEAYLGSLAEPAPEHWSEALAWWRAELSNEDRRWMRELPAVIDLVISARRIRLLHASSTDEHTRMRFAHTPEQFRSMFENTPFTADVVELGRLGGYAAQGFAPTVVGYGDIHDAYQEVEDGRLLMNVGSLGNPLDEPRASYVVLEGAFDQDCEAPFSAQFVRVPYDIEGELERARALGMPDLEPWERELRTAVHRGRR